MSKSSLCDYSDAYILVKGILTLIVEEAILNHSNLNENSWIILKMLVLQNAKIAVPLKHLSNFWRTLKIEGN